MQQGPGAQQKDLAKPALPSRRGPFGWVFYFLKKTLVTAHLDMLRLRHDPSEILMRAIQPALWLLDIRAGVHQITRHTNRPSHVHRLHVPRNSGSERTFISIFFGIATIWERDLGVVHKFLVSPTSARRPGARQVRCSGDQGAHSSRVYLYTGAAFARPDQLASSGSVWRADRGFSWSSSLLHLFAHYRLYRQDPRTLHGHRPDIDHADVFCEQCDLPYLADARLVKSNRAEQSSDL